MDNAKKRTSIAPLALCIVLFAIADFLFVPLIRVVDADDMAVPLVFACMGAIGAQGPLHAIWFVLAPVDFQYRLATATFAGLVWYLSWTLGYAIEIALRQSPTDDVRFLMNVAVSFLCLPLLILSIHTPVWLVRICFSWRIARPENTSVETSAGKFGLRDVFLAMAVVAMALASVRLADTLRPHDSIMPGLVIAALVGSAISLCTTLPLIVATLRARRLLAGLAVTLWLEVMVVVAFIVTISIVEGARPPSEIYGFAASLTAGFFLSTTTVMLVVRSLGYRLLWGSSQ